MKESVVDIQDLQELLPIFRGHVGSFIGKCLIKWLSIDKVNLAHARNCHLRGAAFTSALLKDPLIDVKYKLHRKEILDHLPEGAFVTVSNHPIGSLDGIILIDIFASRRPDFKVMANGVLTHVGAMEDNFISVVPDSTNQGTNMKNISGVRLSLQQLRDGHPMGFFPAGAISMYNRKTKKIQDLPWTHSVIRLIRKAQVPVYPIFFDFLNSNFFYWLARINWRIRTFQIPAEVFNKRGRTVDVYVGEPIPPDIIRSISDDKSLADFLYRQAYGAKK